MNKNKNAQVSIFLIVGLLIIIGGGVFFYFTNNQTNTFQTEIKIAQEQIPIEFDPVKSYANDCAYDIGVEALKIIGKQGGYITFKNRSLNNEPFTITQSPTESDAVFFTRNSDLLVPYWHYLKSTNTCANNCQFSSKRPELRQSPNSIEKQMERYIGSRFVECINNFEPFVEQGYKFRQNGKLKTDVTISSKDVIVLVQYPIVAEQEGTKSELNQFIARVPVNLEKVYDLSTKVTNLQVKHHYLEKHIASMIVAFSGVNSKKLPPMSDMQFEFGSSVSWKKSEVKQRLIEVLSSYIPLFQVDGTHNYKRNIMDSELRQRLYDAAILPAQNKTFKDLSVYFTYLDFWPAYFDLNCKGENCVPDSAGSFIPFIPFGIQTYRFAYDLSYPVFVEIEDPFALNGQGYRFNFFLEGNIRNNEHMNADFDKLLLPSYSGNSQLCDIRPSGNITVNVKDAATKGPVVDSNVLYTVTGESCFIGVTDEKGTLHEQFPIGIGGSLNLVTENYIGKSIEFDAKLDAGETVDEELTPIYTKKLIIRKKNVVKTINGWEFRDLEHGLNEKEAAFVTLKRVSDGTELEYSSIANFKGNEIMPSEIEVAPGEYIAEITLMLNERVVIPKSEKCVSKLIFGEECFEIAEVDFSPGSSTGNERFPEGGLKLNITIGSDELKNHDSLVLYVVSIDLAAVPEAQRAIEDAEQISKIEEYSKTYALALRPKFE